MNRPTIPSVKFTLLIDLGIIMVPDIYVHENWLTTFGRQNGNRFNYYSIGITDKGFPNPTRILRPGDKLYVRVIRQIGGRPTTSEERIAFLATQKAIHTGAQGASLVFDQKRDKLLRGKWYASFDEEDRLIVDAGSGVPCIGCSLSGNFDFHHFKFKTAWKGDDVFFCFNEVEP